MIELIRGRVFWHEAYNNPPRLELLLSHNPQLNEFRFERREDCYFAELDGICVFFSWSGQPDRGYGGATFTVTMKDGTKRDLIGPWSSSAGAMNDMGFPLCVEAAIIDDPAGYERGYTFYSGAVTMALLGRSRENISVPPYRFSSEGTPWKGFDRRFHFPEGSRFTMYEVDGKGRPADRQASGEQSLLLGGGGRRFVPCVELPGGGHWIKPNSHHVPLDPPEGSMFEELVPDSNEWMKTRSYVGAPKT